MRIYCIVVQGDNDALHEAQLRQAVEFLEKTGADVYRAWSQDPKTAAGAERLEDVERLRRVR